MNVTGKNDVKKHYQLCWRCEKACGGCSWSRDFTPVPGWKAKPTKIISYTANENGGRKKYYMDSYEIHECPEFEIAEIIKKNMGRRGFRYDR